MPKASPGFLNAVSAVLVLPVIEEETRSFDVYISLLKTKILHFNGGGITTSFKVKISVHIVIQNAVIPIDSQRPTHQQPTSTCMTKANVTLLLTCC